MKNQTILIIIVLVISYIIFFNSEQISNTFFSVLYPEVEIVIKTSNNFDLDKIENDIISNGGLITEITVVENEFLLFAHIMSKDYITELEQIPGVEQVTLLN